MSQENVDAVRRVIEQFNARAVDGAVEGGDWSLDATLDASQSGIPGLGVYRGIDAVRRFFEQDWFGAFPFEDWEIHIEEIVEHGDDQVVALTRQRGRGASSGVASELELFNIFALRDGQVVWLTIFTDHRKGREAAGLSE